MWDDDDDDTLDDYDPADDDTIEEGFSYGEDLWDFS